MRFRVFVKFGFLLTLTGMVIPVSYCAGTSVEEESKLNATARPAEGHNRIIGGKKVGIDEYPFKVSIQIVVFNLKQAGPLHLCGGTLLYPSWVLTAAHCALNMQNPKGVTIRKASRFSVVAGMTIVNTVWHKGRKYRSADSDVHRRRVNETHINQYFHPTQMNDDIALMRLSSPFSIGAEVQLVKMPTSSTYDETKQGPCFAIGWGRTSREDETLKNGIAELVYIPLKDLKVEIQDFDECQKSIRGSSEIHIFADRTVCTLGKGGGVFKGDSGGGLVCGGVQMGIASFVTVSLDKSEPLPDVFTRIDFYLDWINATISTATSLHQSQMKLCLYVAACLMTTVFISSLL